MKNLDRADESASTVNSMSESDDVKTKFRGPGEWRSQARRLESQAIPTPDEEDDLPEG